MLIHWRLIRTDLRETHAVGYNLLAAEGRVSSPLVRLDVVTGTAVTRSGRMYTLDGASGDHPDARYVFDAWLALNRVQHWEDVTEEVLAHGLMVERSAHEPAEPNP